MKGFGNKLTLLKAAFLLAALGLFLASCIERSPRIPVTITGSNTLPPVTARVSTSNFDKFSHKIPEHEKFDCVSCHQREGKQRELEFAGHESCVGCHLSQFISKTVSEDNRAMCAICHASLDSNDPPMKAFPTRFKEGFNMKFDHAAHERGKGRPAQGCAFCHSPSGPGQTIPSGIDTHNNCYTCHTPESKIGSCTTCHEIAPYRRTLMSQYSFRGIFTHGDHRGVSCSDCHNTIAGAGQGRQVTNIEIRQHLTAPGNNCLQCHNGRRAFTGNNPFDVASCSRCHGSSGPSQISSTSLPEGTTPDPPPATP